ncbi:hypothetical protein PIROE2DRAFT_8383 [Piromyces sp. E2]|nr:hypothetical protein PIROE2DRAFT_8383 [Piromyces sp. E2]|eukprot:OUM64769.1 hypothetical protein PIROE2DRAFT_8383 [Piromyces sp. E2]
MNNKNKILSFLLNSLLLINSTFAKSIETSSNDGKVITKNRNNDQKYLIFVNNTFGEFDIFSNPNNQKFVKRQELDSYDFAVSLMDEIDELINDNRDTFKDQEKLEEIDNKNKLRKRNNEDRPADYYENSSFVHPVSSHGNNLLISAYLSEKLAKIIEKMDNVEAVIPDIQMGADANYYNKNDILKESSWKDLSVQENADLHLSVISQGLYDNKLVGQYDKNFYYPSSAGKGIDIIVIDGGFNFGFSEFNNKGNRTAKCRVVFDDYGSPNPPNDDNSCGSTTYFHGHKITDIAAGIKHGVAKNANIYGVAIPASDDGQYSSADIIEALEYVLKNMIRPNKTVINVSIGSFWEKNGNLYNKRFETYTNVIDRITNKGGIVVVSAGNNGKNVDQGSELYVSCVIGNTICVGGVDSYQLSSVTKKFTRSKYSNYGKQVDIYAPFDVIAEYVENGKVVKGDFSGTSYSTPLVSGIIASIISDNPNTKFTKNSILNHLQKNGISINVDGLSKKVINNGKHIVYSSNNKYNGCGINAGNKPCSNSCRVSPVG